MARAISRLVGSIIGTGAGFWWSQSGKNSLSDDQVRQLPGFMCLLPQDKLEIYLKTLFHLTAGKRHARLPYNYLAKSDFYPDILSTVLGKSEISFTFTLTDNIMLTRYDTETGNVLGTYKARTADIGQDKGNM